MAFVRKIITIFLIFLLILAGCSGSKSNTYRSVPPVQEKFNVYQVYVDSSFSLEQKNIIKKAVKEWNGVLNGYITISIMTEDLDNKNVRELHDVYYRLLGNSSGLMILNLDNDDELAKDSAEGALAFVNAIGDGAKMMVVLRDRVVGRNLHKIILHEFGHAFGAKHIDNRSLMYPYYGPYQPDCVDILTASQVANYHGFDFKKMNYCGGE